MHFKMKIIKLPILFLALSILLLACQKKEQLNTQRSVKIDAIPLDSSSVRAILALPDSSLFYASSDGYMGLVLKTGEHLREHQVIYDSLIPSFRAIATNGSKLFALSVGNPALLFKYEDGKSELVYKEVHDKVFYDALAFFDGQNGIAMGDPTETCLSVLLTNDGGEHWHKIPCEQLPKTAPGEAAFAASNSNIAIVNNNVWMVTGGAKARVFHSADMGQSWQVYDTPIISGQKMTGIYSVDFFDSNNGIIFGGNWEDKTYNFSNKAVTSDGGKSWQLVSDGQGPGYRSCVQYVPETAGKELIALGSTGISFSNDGGHSWREISNERDFYTLRFVNKDLAWLAGKNKIAKMTFN